MTKTNYIPMGEIWKGGFFSVGLVEKVPLSKIKIDKNLFAWQNEVDFSEVDFIIENFNLDFWMPIRITEDYFLLDGQHRLQVARKMGLEFIDACIDTEKTRRA